MRRSWHIRCTTWNFPGGPEKNQEQFVMTSDVSADIRTSASRIQVYRVSEKYLTNGNFIYYLHYMLCMFTPTLYAFSQPLYHVCADFAQRIGVDSSTAVGNSLPKLRKISDYNSIHLCLQESPSTISTLSSNFNATFSLSTFNFNL
jgi:hypothetical protein